MRRLPLDFRDQYFGCEIELTGINRATAAQTLADLFGTRAEHSGGGYDAYRVKDLDGKEWKIVRDGSIHPECRRRSVLIGETYKVELNSPKLEYGEMEKLQEVVRSLRRAGGIVNDSCGMHVHVDASKHTPQSLKNVLSIMYSKEDILFAALKVNPARIDSYCQAVDEPILEEIRKLPSGASMDQLKDRWYQGRDGSDYHYHSSRYRACNMHSVFYHGTIEWRLFNSTLHAGEAKANIILAMAISAQGINQKYTQFRKTPIGDNPAFTFRTFLLRLGLIGPEYKNVRMSINEIAEHLNTIYPKENSKWNPRTIHAILRNEKYIGDSLYQKTYTTDSLPLKRYLNTGQRSKYYAMETHEGIISKTDYEKVQNLLAKKSITGEIDRTCVFSKKIYCSICGAICSRKGPPTQGFVWCCRTHLQSKALCLLKSIREDELQQAFLSIYNRLQCNQKTILEPLVDDLLGLRHLQEQKYKKRLALGEDIQHLAKQKHNLTRIHTLGYIEEPQFIERSAAIEQQIRERKQQLSRNDMSNTSEKILQKTRLIQKKLSSTPPLELFDESVFKELVKKVLISNTAIQFELINGMKLSESRAAT